MASIGIAGWTAILTGIQAGIQVHSAVEKREMAKATGKFNAAKLRNDAMRKEAIGRLNMKRQRVMDRRYLSSMKAKFAAAGVQLQGTPLAVLGDTAGQLEADVADIAFQANAQADALHQSASLTLAEGKAASRAATLDGAAAAFNGLSSAGSSMIDLKGSQPGTPTPIVKAVEVR